MLSRSSPRPYPSKLKPLFSPSYPATSVTSAVRCFASTCRNWEGLGAATSTLEALHRLQHARAGGEPVAAEREPAAARVAVHLDEAVRADHVGGRLSRNRH